MDFWNVVPLTQIIMKRHKRPSSMDYLENIPDISQTTTK